MNPSREEYGQRCDDCGDLLESERNGLCCDCMALSQAEAEYEYQLRHFAEPNHAMMDLLKKLTHA